MQSEVAAECLELAGNGLVHRSIGCPLYAGKLPRALHNTMFESDPMYGRLPPSVARFDVTTTPGGVHTWHS